MRPDPDGPGFLVAARDASVQAGARRGDLAAAGGDDLDVEVLLQVGDQVAGGRGRVDDQARRVELPDALLHPADELAGVRMEPVDQLEVAFAVLADTGGADRHPGEVPGDLYRVHRPAGLCRLRVLGDLPVELPEREPAAVGLVLPQPQVFGVELLRAAGGGE